MNVLKVNDSELLVQSISKFFIQDNCVIAKDFNGEKYILYSAPRKELCIEFLIQLKKNLALTDTTLPVIDYVYALPRILEVELGKIGFIEPFWNGAEGESTTFNYRTSNINIAEAVVGNVVGVGVGTTNCTVSRGAKNDTIKVDVTQSKDNIMFDHLSSMNNVGGGYMISLIDNGKKVPFEKITFHTSDKTIANVSDRGAIDCLKAGVVMITGTYNGEHYGHILEVK